MYLNVPIMWPIIDVVTYIINNKVNDNDQMVATWLLLIVPLVENRD